MILITGLFEKQRIRRRNRQGLIYFFESLALNLKAGFSLSYSWSEVLQTLGPILPKDLQTALVLSISETQDLEGISDLLYRLQNNPIVQPNGMWFSVLRELYESGASMTRCVDAISSTLRREQERDLDGYCRTLPIKVNVVLMIFFLPPTFLWLFTPLIIEILGQFK